VLADSLLLPLPILQGRLKEARPVRQRILQGTILLWQENAL